MKRIGLTASLVVLLSLSFALNSSADGPKIVNEHLFGSTPNVTIRGVVAGGAPWVLDGGRVQLDPSGRLKVRGNGLVIAAGALASGDPVPDGLVGTVATVTTVHAALTCGGPGGGVPFTITPTDEVPLSSNGDFKINALIEVPSVCAQPIVLIRIGAPADEGPWIAASRLPE